MNETDSPEKIEAYNTTREQYNSLLKQTKLQQKNYGEQYENLKAKYIIESGSILQSDFKN